MKVFLAHSARDRDLVDAVATQLRSDGHETIGPDEIAAPTGRLSAISSALRSADVVVVIVNGTNPNIFYELGLAAGAGVPILIVAKPGEVLPADVTSVPYVQLTGDSLRDEQTIARRVKDLEGLSSPKPAKFPSAEAALRAANQDVAVLEALPPNEFEQLVAHLFKERGYDVTLPTLDSGVDFIARSSDGQLLLVEVKKLSKQSRVSVEAVRRLLGIVSLANSPALGVLVSASGFTDAAIALAAAGPIVLRTLEEFLAARSKHDLVESKPRGDRSSLHSIGMIAAWDPIEGKAIRDRLSNAKRIRIQKTWFPESTTIQDGLRNAIDQGAYIEMLLCKPDSQILKIRSLGAAPDHVNKDIWCGETSNWIVTALRMVASGVAKNGDLRFVIGLHDTWPGCPVIWADDQIYMGFYFRNNSSPHFPWVEVAPGSKLAVILESQWNAIMNGAIKLDSGPALDGWLRGAS